MVNIIFNPHEHLLEHVKVVKETSESYKETIKVLEEKVGKFEAAAFKSFKDGQHEIDTLKIVQKNLNV